MSLLPSRQSQMLTDHIRAMISAGAYGPGSRLPSIRQLAGDFNLSIGGVQRVIAKLESSGLLESRRGAGIFVRPGDGAPFRGKVRRIAVIMENNPSKLESYCAHAMRGIEEKAAEHGCILELDYRGCSISARELEEKAAVSDAMFLLGMRYDELLEPANFSCPVIGVEIGNRHGGKASVLSLDPFAAAELAVEFFRARDYRQVVVYMAEYPQLCDRAVIFKNRWEEIGAVEVRNVAVSPYPADPKHRTHLARPYHYNLPVEYFNRPDCGYLFTSSDFYRHAVTQHRDRFGANPNLSNAILTYDGKPFLVPGYEPGNTVMPDWVEVGRCAFNELLRRLQNPGCPSRRIYLDCSLKEYDFSAMKYR